MTPERRNPINDEVLEQAIRSTLNVDPSPAFQARVRERIVAEPAGVEWRWPWRLAGLAAAAAIAGIVTFVWTADGTPGTERVAATTAATRPSMVNPVDAAPRTVEPVVPSLPTSPGKTSAAAVAPRHVDARPARVVQPALTASAEPDILLDEREIVAFRRLIGSLDPSRVDLRSVQREIPSVERPLPALAAVAVDPVVVTPLPSLND